jgi:hypothetical protein
MSSLSILHVATQEMQFINELAAGGWINTTQYRDGPLLNFVLRYTMTVKDAAEHFWCTEQIIISLIDANELGGVRSGNPCRVSKRGIERLGRNPHFIRRLRQGKTARQGSA